MQASSRTYQSWLAFLKNLELDEVNSAFYWATYGALFDVEILTGPMNDPRFNVSYTEAFEHMLDPEVPVVFQIAIGFFLADELSRLDFDLAHSVKIACVIDRENFEKAFYQAPDNDLLHVPEFRCLYEKIRQLENERNSESGIALAF